MGKQLFLKDFPNILKEWDYELNSELLPETIPAHSNKKYNWVCLHGHKWQARLSDRVNDNTKCPFCSNRRILVGFNDLATTHPELSKEWDYEKNEILTPKQVVKGSSKKVWWKCDKGHSWCASISSRACGQRGCPVCSGNKVETGFNDLATLYPEVLKYWDYSKNNIDPTKISSANHTIVWWKCDKGHSYEMAITKKTVRHFGCPICSNYRIEKGFNDLATLYPNIAAEWHPTKNGEIMPSEIGKNSTKKFWWICKKGHEWQATPHDRTSDNTGCPICSARRGTSFPEQAIYYYLKKLYPDAINRYKDIFDNGMELDVFIPSIKYAIEYDGRAYHRTKKEHDKELLKYSICKSNDIKLLRVKERHDNVWNDTADNIITIESTHGYKELGLQIQRILDYLNMDSQLKRLLIMNNGLDSILSQHSSIVVDLDRDRIEILSYLSEIENSLKILRPDIAEQWDYEKNFPLSPEMFSTGSNYKAWWKCTKCGRSYLSAINHKNRNDSRVCPKCSKFKQGRTFTLNKVKQIGSLRQTNPELAKEFHPTKNLDLTPDNITAGRFKRVWWKCSKCDYEWQASPNARKSGIGCPHCSGRVPMTGVDDLLTVNPELCKEWDYNKNTIDPSKMLPGSGKKAWWKCSKCGYEWQTKIYNRKKHGCPKCDRRHNKNK